MKVSFYNNYSEKNVLNKNIVFTKEIDIIMKDTFDINNPSVLLSSKDIKTLGNYCYIESIEKYFFIDKYEIVNNSLIKLFLSCDYLLTYKDVILNSSGYVVQSKTLQNYSSTYNVLDTVEQKITNFSDIENKFTDNKLYLVGAN